MKIIVTGGAGFLGSLIIQELLARQDSNKAPLEFSEILSLDLAPSQIKDERVRSLTGDLSNTQFVHQAVTRDTVAIYHLAAVLSGGSAENFDLAYSVNVEGTRNLLDAARTLPAAPRFIFTSSLAVFGGNIPQVVDPQFATQPDSTYGAFKAIGELMVNEYSRMGFIDARITRLPTISVRPGVPNSAASSFASGMIREPLNALRSVCPVPLETALWLSSPRVVVKNLLHALELSPELLGNWRAIDLPGITVTAGHMLGSLAEVAGEQTRSLVELEPDQRVMDIVCSWPGSFDVEQALALGFERDTSFSQMVRQYRDDYMKDSEH